MTVETISDHPDVLLLTELARARGRAGRWPDGNFEDHDDWCADGNLIDQLAVLLNLETEELFALYTKAHAEGLAARKEPAP